LKFFNCTSIILGAVNVGITLTVDICVQHGGRKELCRVGLYVLAIESCQSNGQLGAHP